VYLGIEIGGTKLQLAVSPGGAADFEALERFEIDTRRGAQGILGEIERSAGGLLQRHNVSRIGIGFGGPVDSASGRVIISHQVDGWKDFPLAEWCRRVLGAEAVVGNDCDVAALAEAKYGAGHGKRSAFYVTVGTGIGGGFVRDGALVGVGRPAASEIGHLRPGLSGDTSDATVESIASGTGIANLARARAYGRAELPSFLPSSATSTAEVQGVDKEQRFRRDLLERAGGDLESLTGKLVGQAAAEGNGIARETIAQACRVLGWAIAQTITLLAPEVVIVGGGVSLLGEELFLEPVRQAVRQYVFPPLADSYEVVSAALGESVVVHGAITLAALKGPAPG
jgi:glucokinase